MTRGGRQNSRPGSTADADAVAMASLGELSAALVSLQTTCNAAGFRVLGGLNPDEERRLADWTAKAARTFASAASDMTALDRRLRRILGAEPGP